MRLMKLAPETVRLRRVAKAHALGEFSLLEYRQARREVIDNFEAASAGDEDTQPRIPQPRAETTVSIQVPASKSTGHAWIGWLLAVIALLAASQLFAAAGVAAEGVLIPAVAQRDPNPATSPRLPVLTVRLNAGEVLVNTDWLDEGQIQAVIDARLNEIRRRNQPGDHGFTEPELAEIGRLLKALGAHGPDAGLTRADAADLSALLNEQQSRRGISVVELEEVAAAVQAELRTDGYFLAIAYLPAQMVVAGEVRLGVLPGVLGDVAVSGAGARLANRFNDLIGQPVTAREINTRLYALNQAPGFSAQASFEAAEKVGETQLNLTVLEKRGVRGNVALDNYGDRHTGRQRLVLSGDLINLAGRGDVLTAGLLSAIEPSNQLLGFVEYAAPIGSRRQLRGRLARNDFNTGGADSIEGNGWLLDGVLETYLYRDRLTGLSWEVGVARHDLGWLTAAGESIEQQVSSLSTALNARRVWDEVRVAADFRLYADVGSVNGDTFDGQNDRFWVLGFNLFGWHPFDIDMLPGRQKASIQLRGQLAGTQLPSTRRIALGGISAARGFERDVYLADKGLLLRGDLRTPLAWGELSVFADVVYGKDQNELTPSWAHLADLGVSWDVRVGRNFLSSLSWAIPITAKGTGDIENDGSKLFWSLRYAY